MTECMVYCFNRAGMPPGLEVCGRPGPCTAIELMDDNMIPVPTGAEGVLCVRSNRIRVRR